jgi:hypothetical protein
MVYSFFVVLAFGPAGPGTFSNCVADLLTAPAHWDHGRGSFRPDSNGAISASALAGIPEVGA